MTDKKREMYAGRILATLFIAIMMFILIFVFSNQIVNNKTVEINEKQRAMYYDFVLEILQFELANNCNDVNLNDLSEELDKVGVYVSAIENRLGKDNEILIMEKKEYLSLEVQHMLLMSKRNELCDKKNDIILFFYSNSKNHIDSSEKTGHILTNVKSNNQDVLVYSFDFDLDFPLINFLKLKYNILSPNTVIVNNERVLSVRNVDDITNLIS